MMAYPHGLNVGVRGGPTEDDAVIFTSLLELQRVADAIHQVDVVCGGWNILACNGQTLSR